MTAMRHPGVTCVLAAALLIGGCNNPKRRSPELALPSGVGSGNGTVSGALTAFSGGLGVSGATVRLASSTAVSTTTGAFMLTGTPENGSAIVTASLPGFVFRGVAVSLSPARAGVQVDMIQEAAPFNLTFYRQFVRNASEGVQLEPIRRWTMNPSFYFRQRTADTNELVPMDVIQSIQQNFTNAVPTLSGGRFTVAAFEVGDAARETVEGWVNVTFTRGTPVNCGLGSLGCASVGGNSGNMTLRNDPNIPSNASTNPYNCTSSTLAVADHEITHTMGFWHTDDSLTDTFSGNGCPGNGFPANTLFHANLAYSRPVGNMDPDVDPVATAHVIAPFAAARPMAHCEIASFRRR